MTDLDGFFYFLIYGGVMVVDGIERGSEIGLGFWWCVNRAKVVAVTGDVVADC